MQHEELKHTEPVHDDTTYAYKRIFVKHFCPSPHF